MDEHCLNSITLNTDIILIFSYFVYLLYSLNCILKRILQFCMSICVKIVKFQSTVKKARYLKISQLVLPLK